MYSLVPIVFLTYYNTIYRRGIDTFYCEAHKAGVDGILVADMPVEESAEVVAIAAKYGIDPIFLITQTTSYERMDRIVNQAKGYLYLVSVLGVTGARKTVAPRNSPYSTGSGSIRISLLLSVLVFQRLNT